MTKAKFRARKLPSKYTKEFEEWWTAYPPRDSKGSKYIAFQKWWQATEGSGASRPIISKSKLLSLTKEFAKSRQGQDSQFTPMAQTWLYQRRWEVVEPHAERKPSKSELAG